MHDTVACDVTNDPVSDILPYAASQNDVLRCLALRALAAQGDGDPRVKSTLREALLDPDPDVRADAMGALRGLADAGDADTIRRSLQGDPVREVKEAALGILGDLQDTGSVPLLEKLAQSRSEDCVTWEDEAGTWDEWLEIQAFAVTALGHIGASQSVEALCAAREGAGGDLDPVVFRSLAMLGEPGAAALFGIVRSEGGLGRKRALEVLSRGDPELLRQYLPQLLGDGSAAVRRLAVPLLSADDPHTVKLALHDPDPELRKVVVSAYGPENGDLAIAALSDRVEDVVAAGLGALRLPLDDKLTDTLSANVQAWLKTAGPALTLASVARLPDLAPTVWQDVFIALIDDDNRPLEARLAALQSLSSRCGNDALEVLEGCLKNRSAQIRVLAITELRGLADVAPDAVSGIFCAAVGGALAPAETAPDDIAPAVPEAEAVASHDAAAGRGETGERSVRISPQGDIVPVEDAFDPAQSTLASITQPGPEALAQDPPQEPVKSRAARKRVAVEGPDDFALDLRLRAIALASDLAGPEIEDALVALAGDEAPEIVRAAQKSIAERAKADAELTEPARAILRQGVTSEDPDTRARCISALAGADGFAQLAETAFVDKDPLVRVAVLEGLQRTAQPRPIAAFSDPNHAVRTMAAAMVISDPSVATIAAAERLFDLGDAQNLGRLAASQEAVKKVLCDKLRASDPRAELALRALGILQPT